MFLPDYKYSIWVDGSVVIKTENFYNLARYILKNNEMAFLKHPDRNCIYEEMKICIEPQKDDQKIITQQIKGCKREGYPEKNGLIAGGIIFRRNKSQKVKIINEEWWREIKQKSLRDQLSFNYVAWKNNFKYFVITRHVK